MPFPGKTLRPLVIKGGQKTKEIKQPGQKNRTGFARRSYKNSRQEKIIGLFSTKAGIDRYNDQYKKTDRYCRSLQWINNNKYLLNQINKQNLLLKLKSQTTEI
ncbi:hypothetical protein [Mangrovibacter plantisponsor]|uniref:hypothetical protein n=1 Tax=Mangrovibacter plantisponsor TaxID=451513 RepID=UPI000D71B037|nr:hypothetical protein [Mangrovibacter plantisponsor]